MACSYPVYLKDQNITVPCGKCFYCRRKYVLMWTLRLTHELISYKNNAVFVTLTYNNENLPADKSVNIRDIQLFIKRVRKYFKDIKIKYYCVSEYGNENKTYRPHYHLILYGLHVDDEKKAIFKMSHLFTTKLWKKGFTTVKPCNSDRIGYTVKYLMKNYLYENDKIIKKGYKPNFSLKSKGLGLDYLLENWKDYIYRDFINFKKYKIGVPRYYKNKLIENNMLHPDYPAYVHKVYLDTFTEDIFKILRKVRGSDYTNPYKTISSYFTGKERDLDWFIVKSNPDLNYYEIDGNHKQHFFYHYLLYIRDKEKKDELEFFSRFSVKKKIHKKGVSYGAT